MELRKSNDVEVILNHLSEDLANSEKSRFAVSSLIYPRKHFFEKDGRTIDEKSTAILTRGIALGNLLEEKLINIYGGYGEYEVEYKGITGHIDFYDAKRNIPYEIKTCSKEITVDTIINWYMSYIGQLSIYMSILDADVGKFLFFNVVSNTIYTFDLSIEKEIRKKILEIIEQLKVSIENAEDVFEIPHCFMNSCKFCSYKNICVDVEKEFTPNPLEEFLIEEVLVRGLQEKLEKQ